MGRDARPDARLVASHVVALSDRTSTETALLMATMVRSSWPGGIGDRIERPGLEWLRRWQAKGGGVIAPDCTCAEGRCRVCN